MTMNWEQEFTPHRHLFCRIWHYMSKEKKYRVNPVKLTRLIIVIIVLCGLMIGAGYLAGRSSGNERQELSAVVVQNQISEIAELATITYSYTELGQYESSKEFYGTKVPFTTNKFILTYDGVIKAGVNVSKAQIEEQGGTITVRLPQAQVLSHEIDENSVKVFDEKTSIFNQFTVEDYTAFYADQKKSVEEKAIAKGLLIEARSQAVKAVTATLEPLISDESKLVVE